MSTDTAHFVLLSEDGTATYHIAGEALRDAIRAHVPDLSSQGHGRLRWWFADNMSAPALRYNALADGVLSRLGYRHHGGWFGPVAITQEEDPHTHDIAPLSPEIRETVDEVVAQIRAEMAEDTDPWAAALAVPALVPLVHTGELMFMCTDSTAEGRAVWCYKHDVTRRYAIVDASGQTWQAVRRIDGQHEHVRIDHAQALAVLLATDEPPF